MTVAEAARGSGADEVTPRELLTEQVRLVYRMASGAPWTMLAVSLLIVTVLHDLGPPIYLWLAVQATLKIGAYIDYRWFFTEAMIGRRPEHAMYRLMISQAPHAMGWAALTLVGAQGSDFQLIFITMMMGGVLGAGVTTYGAKPLIHIAYIAAYVVAEGVNYLLLASVIAHNPIAFYSLMLTSIYCVGIFTNTRVAGRTYRDSILLGFANASLAKRLEREVQSTKAARSVAEAANAAKSTFLAAASHDLRQPIHALGLFLGLLERSKLNGAQRESLTHARSALTASSEMLDALLDFSRAEAGTILPKRQSFELGRVLREIEAEVALTADEKRLVYRTRDCGAVVDSDPSLVKIIILNLVSNAIRYSSRGGLLVGWRRRGERIVVEVWDTGAGVPEEDQEAIFSDFVQLGNPERDRRKGIGLGLAIARRLARLIGSEVTLNSIVGRGSVFRFSLPLAPAGAQPEAEAPQPPPLMLAEPIAAKHHVMVLDDDETIRLGLSALLRQAGYSVDAAESIAEAQAYVHRQTPHLLICDSRLRAGERGAQAARVLRAQIGHSVPAILITGDTHPERIAEAACEDMEIVYKPTSPNRLLELIERLTQNT